MTSLLPAESTTDHPAVPACWQDVDDALAAGIDRLILFGPPGTGKTHAGLTAGDIGAGAFRLICTEEMSAADVTGHFMPTAQGSWAWSTGSVLQAWIGDGQRGGRVVADEIDKASGDVLALLLNMFDTHESASWRHPETGVIHRPLAGFSVIMTSNIEELRLIPTALRDRFPIAIRIDRPHPNALAHLPQHLWAPAMASADAEESHRFSLRAFFAFDHLCRSGLGADRAAHLVFGDKASAIIDALVIDRIDDARVAEPSASRHD